MRRNIDKRLWGVPGKMKTYYSPQKQVEGKTKTPLNPNAFESWDYKRSRYKRIDGYENRIQQGGVVPQGTQPVPSPSSTPVPTPTPTPSPVPILWNTNTTNWNDENTNWES